MGRIDIEALEDEWEEDHHLLAERRRSEPLSEVARRVVAEHAVARVVAVDRGRVTVVLDGAVLPARFAGGMRGTKVVVGDDVRVKPPRHEQDLARISELLDRRTVLTRTPDDVVDEERVVVANADQIVIVISADHLDVGVRFADRVLVAASIGGLEPVLCINKVDLATEGVGEVAARYERIGIPARVTSAATGEGVDGLREVLTDMWSAFSGHSGVGKSSLFNLLVPDADHQVGDLGRFGGRHTTAASRAVRIPALNAWLVDTPGVRSFGLGALRPDELVRHFPELARLDCDLDSCQHDGEPGCALRRALDAGEVHPARADSYRRLLAALREEDWRGR